MTRYNIDSMFVCVTVHMHCVFVCDTSAMRLRRWKGSGSGAQRERALSDICVSGALQEMKNENEKEKKKKRECQEKLS